MWGAADDANLRELRGREPGTYYRIWRLIGVGSVGPVYEVFDQRGRKLAVKVLHDVPGGDAAVERFARGARAALFLEHPHIVRVEDFEPVEPMSWRRISNSE